MPVVYDETYNNAQSIFLASSFEWLKLLQQVYYPEADDSDNDEDDDIDEVPAISQALFGSCSTLFNFFIATKSLVLQQNATKCHSGRSELSHRPGRSRVDKPTAFQVLEGKLYLGGMTGAMNHKVTSILV